MNTIGLIGGMSWESTAHYYSYINTRVQETLGGLHSGKILIYSVDFQPLERLQAAGDWEGCARVLGEAARSLERAGADFLLICTNTLHQVFDAVQGQVNIPLLHIARAAAGALLDRGITRAGLLGTSYTLRLPFYRETLLSYGIETAVPHRRDTGTLDRIIFDELCLGKFTEPSRARCLEIARSLAGEGAQAILLACTELGLLLKEGDSPLPLFDTALLHAEAAVRAALELPGGCEYIEGRKLR